MLKTLAIIKGGVSTKDLNPILTHVKIKDGWITSTNGRLTISAPIALPNDIEVIVPATKFIAAVKACKEPKFKITDGGKLSISKGKFRAFLPIMTDVTFPSPQTSGDIIHAGDFIPTINKLMQFVGDDASRSWANGILFYDGQAYATNNVILASVETEWSGPAICIPNFLINELLRIKKEIVSIRSNGETITFQLEDQVWLNSSTLPTRWPNVLKMYSTVDFNLIKKIPEGFQEAIENILPFCPDPKYPKIILSETGVSTEKGDHEASVDMEGLSTSLWRAEPLLNLLSNTDKIGISIDFSQHPRPCPWIRGDGVRGVIVGLKQ